MPLGHVDVVLVDVIVIVVLVLVDFDPPRQKSAPFRPSQSGRLKSMKLPPTGDSSGLLHRKAPGGAGDVQSVLGRGCGGKNAFPIVVACVWTTLRLIARRSSTLVSVSCIVGIPKTPG
jgi:hypothetical protein